MRPQSPSVATDAPPPLGHRYGGLICDLDGVVYRGPVAVPGAAAALDGLTSSGTPVVFATNNAARAPGTVAAHLTELGVVASACQVVTSSQAASAYLASHCSPGARVLAVGGPGVADALEEAGLQPLRVSELADAGAGSGEVVAVVQGLGPDVSWLELAEVGHRVQQGTWWVATNLDQTLPTSRGAAPGNGALVAAVQQATATSPDVVGKPEPQLFDVARARLGTGHAETLVCGDRLDTDVAGAVAAGLDSLLVLSGAGRLRDLVLAPPERRPTYVAPDLSGLQAPLPHLGPRPDQTDQEVEITPDGSVRLRSRGGGSTLLATLVGTAWATLDHGRPLSTDVDLWGQIERELGLLPV